MKAAKPPRHKAPKIDPLTPDEIMRVLAVAAHGRNFLRWLFALLLGIRQGEALGLRWEDIDRVGQVLRIRRQLQRHTWEHGCRNPEQCLTEPRRNESHNCPERFKRDGRKQWSHGCADASRCVRPPQQPRGFDCPLRFGGGLTTDDPKWDSDRDIALATRWMAELLDHEAKQRREKFEAGPDWRDEGCLFARTEDNRHVRDAIRRLGAALL